MDGSVVLVATRRRWTEPRQTRVENKGKRMAGTQRLPTIRREMEMGMEAEIGMGMEG